MFRGETYIILLNSILLYRFSRLIKNSFKWNNNLPSLLSGRTGIYNCLGGIISTLAIPKNLPHFISSAVEHEYEVVYCISSTNSTNKPSVSKQTNKQPNQTLDLKE